ncbi:Smr/MutS family protein [Thioalkalivibrio sp.]|uniref:Smr/MutS family protein n=1 Tax=Thioalkalivibrio sp. TaxID=2093813 RepID=UPI0035644BBD
MARISIDLHACFRDGRRIDSVLEGAIRDAREKRIPTVEIIHGKGSGQLKKRVLRFLQRPDIKAQYHRVEKDSKNHGRLFVHFRH